MSVRCVRALARGVIIGVLAILPCMAAAGDVPPQPSAIEMASTSSESAIERAAFPVTNIAREPFDGLPFAHGPLLEKWNAAKTELRIDTDIIAACRAEPNACESGAAKRIVAIVEEARKRSGRALIGEINRAINLAIAPASDKTLYGVEDYWASPLTTFTLGRGDCEDYALAKYAALRVAGFVENDLRLLIVRLLQSRTDHAVLSVRHDDHWLVLDNRRFAMLDVSYLDAVPLFVLRENDVRLYRTTVAVQERKTDEPLAFAYGASAAGNAPNLM